MNVAFSNVLAVLLLLLLLLLLLSLPAFSAEPADISDPTYLLELASVHLKHDSIQRAQPLIHKALELSKDPAQRDAAVQSLKPVFQRVGNWKDAIAVYEDLLPLALDAAERSKIRLALADAHIKANDPDKGEALLVELARPDKERKDDDTQRQNALNALVQFWEANPKRVDAAIAQADAELAKDEKDSAALERLIRIYSFVKPDLFRQIQYAEKLCALKPDDAGEQRRLAGLYLQDRKYDKAIEVNKRLMAAATSHEDAQNYARQVGNILVQSGKKDDAVTWMHENFEAKITRSGDYVILATFYENAGLPQLAEASFVKWIAAASTPDEKIEGYFRIAQFTP